MSIEDYILKMRNLANSFIMAGQTISDEELILYVLRGLGFKYNFVVVNLTSRQDTITLQEAQFLLQTHEMLFEQLAGVANLDISGS